VTVCEDSESWYPAYEYTYVCYAYCEANETAVWGQSRSIRKSDNALFEENDLHPVWQYFSTLEEYRSGAEVYNEYDISTHKARIVLYCAERDEAYVAPPPPVD